MITHDQPLLALYHPHRQRRLAPISICAQHQTTVANLAASIRAMRTTTAMRTAAAALGDIVRTEDGTGTALRRIIAHAEHR